MHLDVKNCAQPHFPLLPRKIPGYHLCTNISHPQFFSQCQTNGFPVHVHSISNHFDCQSSIRSNKFSYPCCVVSCPFRWWWSAALLIFNKGSAFRKHFVPATGLCCWHCIISKGRLKFSICCGGTFTEFNTQKMAYKALHDIPCFHFHGKVHKPVLTLQAPTPHWGTVKPCHCKWGWRKDQGQRLSVFSGCCIASIARRKLISLLNCQISYVPLSQISEKSLLTHLVNDQLILHQFLCHLMVSGQQFVTFAVVWTGEGHPPGIIFQVLMPLS